MSRKETIAQLYEMWRSDRISERSAALAFYAMVSLVPLLVIGFSLSTLFAGGGVIEDQALRFLGRVFGSESLPFFERVISGAQSLRFNLLFSVIGVTVLLYGASKLFVHLRRALSAIFVIEREEADVIKKAVKERGVSLLYLVLTLVLALIFIVANVALSTSFEYIRSLIGSAIPLPVFYAINTFVSLVVVGGLYAIVYRVGSEFRVRWLYAFSGGLVASLLFLILNGFFSFYLQSSVTLSVFGASFTLVAFLLWVYYGIQILFLGAEVADVYHRRDSM